MSKAKYPPRDQRNASQLFGCLAVNPPVPDPSTQAAAIKSDARAHKTLPEGSYLCFLTSGAGTHVSSEPFFPGGHEADGRPIRAWGAL